MASSKYAAFRQDLTLRWLLRMTKMVCHARPDSVLTSGSPMSRTFASLPYPPGLFGQILADNPTAFSRGYVTLHALSDDGGESDFGAAGGLDKSIGTSVLATAAFEIKSVTAGRYAAEFTSGSGESGKYYVSFGKTWGIRC